MSKPSIQRVAEMAINQTAPFYGAETIAKQIEKIAIRNPQYGINRISYGKHRSDKFGVYSIFVEYGVVEHDVQKIIEKMIVSPSGFQKSPNEDFYSYTKMGAFGVQIRYMKSPAQPAKNIVFDITSQKQATRKPSIERVAYQYLNKKANDEFKEKLLDLFNSGKIDQIKNALVLNDTLGIFTDREIGDILIPKVIYEFEYWKQDGLAWFLLKELLAHREWKKVNYLDLRGFNLTSLPKEIGNLKFLRYLRLDRNNLTSLPKEIGNLKNLEELSLDRNNLTSLPKEIGGLKNLKYLYLEKNNLTIIPKEIGNLKNLDRLYLTDNNLTSIPKEIGNLSNLTTLRLP